MKINEKSLRQVSRISKQNAKRREFTPVYFNYTTGQVSTEDGDGYFKIGNLIRGNTPEEIAAYVARVSAL